MLIRYSSNKKVNKHKIPKRFDIVANDNLSLLCTYAWLTSWLTKITLNYNYRNFTKRNHVICFLVLSMKSTRDLTLYSVILENKNVINADMSGVNCFAKVCHS